MKRRDFVLSLLALAVVPTEAFARRRGGGRRSVYKSSKKSKTYYSSSKSVKSIHKSAKKASKYINRLHKRNKIKASRLNVRSTPSRLGKVIGSVRKNESFFVIEIDGDWGKINYAGRFGWINLGYTTH